MSNVASQPAPATAGTMQSSPAASPRPTLSIAVGIPTRGRPIILKETLADLARQSYPAQAIFVAYFQEGDVGDAREHFPQVTFLQGTGLGGSCSQRNTLLDAVGESSDLILIMDDDCYLHGDYLLRTAEAFAADPRVLGTTGRILENGAHGPGLTGQYARNLLSSILSVPSAIEQPPTPAFNTDGCNMAFRTRAIVEHHLRFDETMPGYAWFEDIDFSRRLLPYGSLLHLPGAQAVHLGAKVGKTSGKRYGYSQIANPIYLIGKGTYFWPNAFLSIGRVLIANLLRSLVSEPYIDRRGRLKGNLLALLDLLQGSLHPGRILKL